MSTERREQAESLFQVAVDLPVERRSEYLCEKCGSDEALRTDVERLLRAHESDLRDFLRPVTRQLPTGRPGDSPVCLPTDRLTGTIGHSRVER